MTTEKKKNTLLYNLAFLVICGGVLLFLLNAPEETTKRIPQDETHLKFYSMGKKEAEKFCEECHNKNGVVPLPDHHPPKYRVLFCHKKVGQ